LVRENYGQVAKAGGAGCGCAPACCSPDNAAPAEDTSLALGYSQDDVSSVPQGANMGLGCGNPQAIASLRPGETVLDLGSGGGFDCFLAAKAVGQTGRVIGVDMTPEMVGKARRNAEKAGLAQVEFRLGEIEHLPVADGTIDVITSNCVINLSPERSRSSVAGAQTRWTAGYFGHCRTVEPSRRREERSDALYAGCMAGRGGDRRHRSLLKRVGFEAIRIRPTDGSQAFIRMTPELDVADVLVSATIEAVKPAA
jgi:SAM-dependent methyltransferase